MIARIEGTLLESGLTSAVVDVNGLGLELLLPLSTVETLPPEGSKVTLLTHFQVREDAMTLYGFATSQERDLFRLLVSAVSGIGPKLALNVLSSLTVGNFCQAVLNGDLKMLSKINGIGKRTAERMIVELRDKVQGLGGAFAAKGQPGAAQQKLSQEGLDAVAALETLGYKRDAAEKVVIGLLAGEDGDRLSAPALIKRALATLNS